MLVLMENEQKIFIAWLKKYVRDDRVVTARWLAGQIDLSPSGVSSYIRDRTKPDFKTRQKILKATGVSHSEMMAIGREVLAKETGSFGTQGMSESNGPASEHELLKKEVADLKAENKQLKEKVRHLTRESNMAVELWRSGEQLVSLLKDQIRLLGDKPASDMTQKDFNNDVEDISKKVMRSETLIDEIEIDEIDGGVTEDDPKKNLTSHELIDTTSMVAEDDTKNSENKKKIS